MTHPVPVVARLKEKPLKHRVTEAQLRVPADASVIAACVLSALALGVVAIVIVAVVFVVVLYCVTA